MQNNFPLKEEEMKGRNGRKEGRKERNGKERKRER